MTVNQSSLPPSITVSLGVSFFVSMSLPCCVSISVGEKREGTTGFVEGLKSWGEENGIGAGQIMMTIRVILTGGLTGVGIQEIVTFIGIESVGQRTENFKDRI